MGVAGQSQAPAALPLGKRAGTHCTRGWVVPRPGIKGSQNLAPGFDPRTFRPVASRYNDYTILVPICSNKHAY
jgi:hypothetical protein